MNKEFFDCLQQWQQDGFGKSVEITFGGPSDKDRISVWVYDYNLMAGTNVGSIAELESLDLKKVKMNELQNNIQILINLN